MTQTVLDSAREKAGKFTVSVERVVSLGNFETVRVGFAEVLDLAMERPEDAYARILEKVNRWTSQLKPEKPAAAPTPPAKPEPAKAEHGTTGADPYLALPWKQSMKKQTLGTILVTPELLQNPLARSLYDKLKEWKSLRADHVSYRFSKMENGAEFLQKWGQASQGRN